MREGLKWSLRRGGLRKAQGQLEWPGTKLAERKKQQKTEKGPGNNVNPETLVLLITE